MFPTIDMHATGKNPFMEVNPAIGSGFDASRGTFHGDQTSGSSPDFDHGNDHPFHNVDYNTMMVCFTWADIPFYGSPGYEKGACGPPESEGR
jgi:hypothetical protein